MFLMTTTILWVMEAGDGMSEIGEHGAGSAGDARPSRDEVGEPAPAPVGWRGWSPWRLVALALGLLFLIYVRRILPPFILAGVLAYLLAPPVAVVQARLRVSRGVATLGVLLLAAVPIVVGAVLAAPLLTRESAGLMMRGPALLGEVLTQLLGTPQVELFGRTWTAQELAAQAVQATIDWLGGPGAAVHLATIVLEATIGGLVMLVTTFYLLLDPAQLGHFGLSLFPSALRPRVRQVADLVNAQLRRYLVGLLFLIGLMTSLTWVGLALIFHQPYALAVALLTGLLELIPLAGPIAAGTVAALVGFTHGGVPTVAGIVLMYFILRQLEDQVVVPLILRRVVELPPVATIFGVLAGSAVAGVLGMILAVPALVVMKVVREAMAEDGSTEPEDVDRG